jgi:hypothetical protein
LSRVRCRWAQFKAVQRTLLLPTCSPKPNCGRSPRRYPSSRSRSVALHHELNDADVQRWQRRVYRFVGRCALPA